MFKISLHHVVAEMIMSCRHRGMRGKDGVHCDTFECGSEVQSVMPDFLAYPFQDKESRMTLIDMPNCRPQPQYLQRPHASYAKNDFLFHAHHLVAAIQAVRDIAIMRTIA